MFRSFSRTAGFDPVMKFDEPPKTGQIMVVGNAGSTFFYVIGGDRGDRRGGWSKLCSVPISPA